MAETPRLAAEADSALSVHGYTYDAFISYRRVSPDHEVALRLHRALEAYRPLRERSNSTRRIRVCLDREEFPASPDLAKQIQERLLRSRFLIVVCSPAAAESTWVENEVEFFLAAGRRDQILLLLIAGNPREAFPPSLRGAASGERGSAEPLAADIRGENLRSSLRKLDEEKLRLLAPILSCDFDDLRRRELKRRAERMRRIAVAATALSLTFLALAGTALWQWRRAEDQRRLAEARMNQAIGVTEKVLWDIDEQLRNVAGTGRIRTRIADVVAGSLQELEQDAVYNEEVQWKQVVAHLRLGHVASVTDQARAKREFTAALTKAQALRDSFPDSPASLQGIADALEGLGDLALSAEDYDKANDLFRRQRETAAQLLKAGHDSPENIHRAVNALRQQGVVKQQGGALDEADRLYGECLQVLGAALKRHPSDPMLRRVTALLYEDQAYLAFRRRDASVMLRLHTAARIILEELVRDHGAPPDKIALAKVYEQFAFMARLSGKRDLERNYWWKAWELVWTGYLAESDNMGYRQRLSVVSEQLAEVRYAAGQLREALPMYTLHVTLSEALFQQEPEGQGALRRLIDARETYAKRLLEAGRQGDAENQYRLLRADADRALKLPRPNADTLLATAEALLMLGDHSRNGKQLASAETDFLRTIELAEQARRERAPPETADYIALMAHGNLVLVATGQQAWNRLRVHLDRAQALLSTVEKSNAYAGDPQIGRLKRLLADVRSDLK